MFKRRKPQSTLEKWQQFIWPREGWTRALKYTWQRTIRLNGSAHSIALGLAAGAFVSASPFMGMHLLIAALIAWVFGGNIIASAVGTWAGNPISFPFIWLTTFNIGHLILGTEDKAGDLPELSLGLYRCADQCAVACDFADGRRRACRRHCDGGGDLLSEPLGCSFLSEKAA